MIRHIIQHEKNGSNQNPKEALGPYRKTRRSVRVRANSASKTKDKNRMGTLLQSDGITYNFFETPRYGFK